MSGTLQDVMYTGPPTSSSGSTASFHGPSPAIHDNHHPSSNGGSAHGNIASGSKRKDVPMDVDDDEDDAEAKKRKQKFTRSRTACFQVCLARGRAEGWAVLTRSAVRGNQSVGPRRPIRARTASRRG